MTAAVRLIYPLDLELTAESEITIKKSYQQQQDKQEQQQHEKKQPQQQQRALQLTHSSKTKSTVWQGAGGEDDATCVRKQRGRRPRDQGHVDHLPCQTVKMTKSGRVVKQPNRRLDAATNEKHRNQPHLDVVTCLRCDRKFYGVTKLNRHFFLFPTHKPNNIHKDLFMCFVEIMSNSPSDKTGDTFVEQIVNFIVKLKNMATCMMSNVTTDEGGICCINEDLARMIEIEPGTYTLRFDEAIECYERGKSKCTHKIAKKKIITDSGNADTTTIWVPKGCKEAAATSTRGKTCTRSHQVDRWSALARTYTHPTTTGTEDDGVCADVDVTSAQKETTVWLRHTANKDSDGEKNSNVSGVIQLPILDLENDISSKPLDLKTASAPARRPTTNHQESSKQDQSVSCLLRFQNSNFDTKPTIEPKNTSTANIESENSGQTFVRLRKDNLLSDNCRNDEAGVPNKPSDMQIDIGAILSELSDSSNNDLNQQTANSHHGKFFAAIDERNRAREDFASSPSVCDLSRRSDISIKNFSPCDETAVRSPSDRVLPSDHMNRNEHLVPNRSQQSNRSGRPNDFVSRLGQNDCLLSGRNGELSAGDALLTGADIRVSRSDELISADMEAARSDSLVNLCGSESNLESSRMNLPLLEQLGGDCLSFADAELRGSALDIPLDLFPFHHTE